MLKDQTFQTLAKAGRFYGDCSSLVGQVMNLISING
ncbi:uncharacterized protein J3R85_001960 [Psidium guajava]|nr:uncharacterized protein J3R85_001960 [Psidium guajava]